MAAPLLIAGFHYAICGIGVTINTVLLAIIVTRTPQNLKCYSILLFSQTLPQVSTCFTSGILFTRLIPKDFSLFHVISGPANLFGSEKISYYLWCLMLHGHAHYSIMLAVCFSYRYYVILHPTPKFFKIVLLVILVYLPTIWFSQSTIYDESTARKIMAARGESYIFDEQYTVTGIVNVLEPSAATAIGWVCAVILGVGRAMSQTLSKNVQYMSETTRASHREIVRGLAFQACLPALYSFSVASYLLGQLNLLNHVVLEYAIHMTGEACVAISPFLTLYYVQPYRRTLRRVVKKDEA
ncbi:hypothetical protein PFISCL1PPCAC_17098, partial [Pristionchus fissidentatus]